MLECQHRGVVLPPAAFPPSSIAPFCCSVVVWWQLRFTVWQACVEQGGTDSWVWSIWDAGWQHSWPHPFLMTVAACIRAVGLRVIAACCPVEHATVVAPSPALRLAWPGALHCTLLLTALAVL